MPATNFALQMLLILLPGFSAAYIVQALGARRTQSDFERVIEALVFSFIIYIADMPLNHGLLPFHVLNDLSGRGNDAVSWDPAQVGWLALITLAFSVLAVAYIRFDGNRVLQKIGLTERTTRNSVWNDIFESEAAAVQPVQVELSDGRGVLGLLVYYSDVAEDASLYLTEASWVGPNGKLTPIPGPGILLTKTSGIRSVSLLNPAPDGQEKDVTATDESANG